MPSSSSPRVIAVSPDADVRDPRPALALAIVAAALLARLVAAVALGSAFHFADEAEYVDATHGLLAGQGFAERYARVPAYPILLALLLAPLPGPLVLLRVVQGAVAALGCLATLALARRLFGAKVALVAATLYALDPLLVVGGGLLYPEALATVFLTVAVLAAWRAAHDDRLGASALAGALLGLVTQLRPVTLLTVPVVALWTAAVVPAGVGRRVAHACVVGLAVAATLAPWTYRNYRVHGELTPVATQGTQIAPVSQSEVQTKGLTFSLLSKALHEPFVLGGRMARELGHFFELYPTRLATDNAYERAQMHAEDPRLPVDTSFRPGIRDTVSAISFGTELVLALAGIAIAWRVRPRETLLLVGVILSYALGYALFVAKLRYRMPVLPALFVFAGVGAAALWARVGRAPTPVAGANAPGSS